MPKASAKRAAAVRPAARRQPQRPGILPSQAIQAA